MFVACRGCGEDRALVEGDGGEGGRCCEECLLADMALDCEDEVGWDRRRDGLLLEGAWWAKWCVMPVCEEDGVGMGRRGGSLLL